MNLPRKITFLILAGSTALFLSFGCSGGTGASPTPPTNLPISIESVDGQSDVAVDSSFSYAFSKTIDSSTVTESTFFIAEDLSSNLSAGFKSIVDVTKCVAANAVAAAVTCSSALTECTIDPANDLKKGTRYHFCAMPGNLIPGIKYTDGSSFEGFMASFTTASDDCEGPSCDTDGDGITDVVETTYSVPPYLSNNSGWILDPDINSLLRPKKNGIYMVPSGVTATAVGLDPNNENDADDDFDKDGKTNLEEIEDGTPLFVKSTDGIFGEITTYSTADVTQFVTIGDFDGNGKIDLATSNKTASSVSILLGTGEGTFLSAVNYESGIESADALGLTVGDFDGDGNHDVAITAHVGTDDIAVMLGNGSGGLGFPTTYPINVTTAATTVIVPADFDGDGDLDLVTSNGDSSDSISFLTGAGNGSFEATGGSLVQDEPIGLAVGDFDGNGKLDIAAANQDAESVSIVLGNGDGTFKDAVNYMLGEGEIRPQMIVTADFDSDGNLDLMTANYTANTVSLLTGNGDGTFDGAVNTGVGARPVGMVAADFNGDNKIDIATANSSDNTVSILMGQGNGTFAAPATYSGMGASPITLTAGDFDNDGDIDLATANAAGDSVSVLLNQNQ